MAAKTTAIQYVKGEGKGSKAHFKCGRTGVVPAALITRLLEEAEGQNPVAVRRLVTVKLSMGRAGGGTYAAFLDELDKAGLDYAEALEAMRALKPSRRAGQPRIQKEVLSTAKVLCRKYSDRSAEEMVAKFVETVNMPEFRQGVVAAIQAFEKAHGRNAQKKVRTRKERADMVDRATVARAGLKRGRK